ncbi:MAG: hypothetical protein QMD65_03375 [Patescibacteria group bacterium]|nr:hypothetical protein [Patescibacteria group bacterium]
MSEKMELQEYSPDFPLDTNFFDRLDNFFPQNPDKQKIKIFNTCVDDSKTKAFSYAEKVLDYLLYPTLSSKEIDKNKRWNSDLVSDHNIGNLLNVISSGLHVVGIDPLWVKDSRKVVIRLMEAVALDYAFRQALNYQKAVKEDHLNPEEALKKLVLANAVKPDYIETKILRKINELPEPIKENLFKTNHDF